MARWPIYIGLIFALVSSAIYQRLKVFGAFRRQGSILDIHGNDVKLIPIPQCEDLHWHQPSNLLFAACADDLPEKRFQWFPPLPILTDPTQAQYGSIYVIDPTTLIPKKLVLAGFTGPFVTHGIDAVSSGVPNIVNIFAINHLPNPDYDPSDPNSDKARSQIEFFKYTIGSDEAVYMRSILHPRLRTPNDILATKPTGMYVTNEFRYREGLLRYMEVALPPTLAAWSDVIFIDILDPKSANPTSGLNVTIALSHHHYPNGLGRSSKHLPEEVLVADASGGILTRTRRNPNRDASPELSTVEHIQMDTTIDNPTFYDDPYATANNNASGYILAGVVRALAWPGNLKDPSNTLLPPLVWHVRSNGAQSSSHKSWEKKVIFQDDGSLLRGATTAVMLPINPEENDGKKQGLLFATSVFDTSVVVTKIDL